MDVIKTDLKQTKAKLQKVSHTLSKKEKDIKVKDKSIEEHRTKITDLESKLKLITQDNDQYKQEIEGNHQAIAYGCHENKRLSTAYHQTLKEMSTLREQYDRMTRQKRHLQSKCDKMSNIYY
jgi:chromosome segregation ATPase